MNQCRSNCQCAGGNCQMNSCQANCQCPGGNCQGAYFNGRGGGGGPNAACQFIPVEVGCVHTPFCSWINGQCLPAMASANDIEGDFEDFDLESEDGYDFEEGDYDEDEDEDWDADVVSTQA